MDQHDLHNRPRSQWKCKQYRKPLFRVEKLHKSNVSGGSAQTEVYVTSPNTLLPKNPPYSGGLRALHLQLPAHLVQYSPDGLFPFTK